MIEPGSTLYHLHSLGASGAPATNDDPFALDPRGHGLRRLGGWLDHVASTGCRGVLLTPLFVSSTHGYDTVDPFRIDQRLGDDGDFASFVSSCHDRGLRVVLDGVFNHVGRAFPRFQDVLARGRSSSSCGWFRLDFGRDDGDGFAYKSFEGHRDLVTLNHDSPEVLDWAADVATHWLDRGADGWRFDAAYAIPRPFLSALTARIRDRHPDAFLFGEVIHGDYAGFAAATGLDVTAYELHKALWSSMNDANMWELAWALQRHATAAEAMIPVTFAGNHDVTRIASQLSRFEHLALVLAVVFTVPGRPCVYYGDELGWRGVKEHRAGGDDAIRQALPDRVDMAGDAATALRLHRELIGFRRERPWLDRARLDIVDKQNHRLTYRVGGDGGELLVIVDVDLDAPQAADGWRLAYATAGVAIFGRS